MNFHYLSNFPEYSRENLNESDAQFISGAEFVMGIIKEAKVEAELDATSKELTLREKLDAEHRAEAYADILEEVHGYVDQMIVEMIDSYPEETKEEAIEEVFDPIKKYGEKILVTPLYEKISTAKDSEEIIPGADVFWLTGKYRDIYGKRYLEAKRDGGTSKVLIPESAVIGTK